MKKELQMKIMELKEYHKELKDEKKKEETAKKNERDK